MRMMRTKMKLLRKKNELQPVTDELKLKKIRMRAKTITGEKIIHASRMESSKVQKTGERVIVGADVEGLYPALEDLEVANICYNAILRSKINFNNIDYRKASIYVAMNISGEETTVHPLGRVLPRRKHKTSSRSWVTGKMKNAENSWNIPEVEWTDLEKRLMMAEMTRMGVIVMMNSHIFRWDGKLYLQRHGGPIGLRATCAVARVTMLFWDEKLACVLKRNHIDLDQGMRYMDDVRLVLDAIHEGWRWTEEGLYYSEGWKIEDEASLESPTQRTGRILKDIMNYVMAFLNLTIEIGDDFEDKKLPTLDLKIWVQPSGRLVFYEHYEKPMKTNLALQKNSALSENVKVSSLSQEVVRVLLNCSEDVDNKTRIGHLEFLSTKLKTSGYNTPYIRKLMYNGIKCYEDKLCKSRLDKNHKNYKPLHLSKEYNASKRRENKLLSKTDWYKSKDKESENDQVHPDNIQGLRRPRKHSKRMDIVKGGDNQTKANKKQSTVMFVPWTIRGRLAARLRQEEDRLADLTGFRIKYTGEGVTQLRRQFSTKFDNGLECVTCDQLDEQKLDYFLQISGV